MWIHALLVAVPALTLPVPSSAASGPAPDEGAAEVPRLVVVIGVDQLIPEQLERLADDFEGGYGRFVRDGLEFRRAMLEHANTETGPGYATLGTGCHPRRHGVIANTWTAPDGSRRIYCVEDPDSPLVADEGPLEPAFGGVSPRNLHVPGLGDWMKRADAESRVVSVAGKDRAAIGLGGQRPDLCLWWNRQSGGFMSSVWYAQALPEWLVYWNAGLADRIFDGPWGEGWVLELPADVARAGTAPDSRKGEAPRARIDDWFHEGRDETDGITRRRILAQVGYRTPLVDLLTLEVARAAVETLSLGADDHPDLLAIGLSGCDVVGHAYGPYSAEVTDLLLRGDRALGELFDFLDERVGAGRWSAVLTADHGVMPLPEEEVARGVQATRIYDSTLRETFEGVRAHTVRTWGADLVSSIDQDGLRLDADALAAAELDPRKVEQELAEWIQGEFGWIERVFTRKELEQGEGALDPWLRLQQGCYDAQRSPDLVFQHRPWMLLGMAQGTSHGSPYPYDRHVPLVLLGPGVAAGRRYDAACTADVAPTVLRWLGIDPPAEMDGRPLPSH
jgi:predicted AlkP superfamily pyrophosphatase or phosphodiesterase